MKRYFLAVIIIAATLCSDARAQSSTMRRVAFDVSEGTAMSIDVSPDGETLLFDLLGDLYTLPVSGGRADLLLGGEAWDHEPRYTSAGLILFASDREGVSNIWMLNDNGWAPRQLTSFPDDGVVSVEEVNGCVFVRRRQKEEREAGNVSYTFDPVISPTGGVCARSDEAVYASRWKSFDEPVIVKMSPGGGLVTEVTQGFRPVLSRNRRFLAFIREGYRAQADRAAGTAELWVRDLEAGTERKLADLGWRWSPVVSPAVTEPLIIEMPRFAFGKDDAAIYVAIEGRPSRVDLRTGQIDRLPFTARVDQSVRERVTPRITIGGDAVHLRQLRWTQVSSDKTWAIFGAAGQIWKYDFRDGAALQLTTGPALHYAPALSPDERQLAYVTWTDAGGQVVIQDLSSGSLTTLVQMPGQYMNPTWSPDGQSIAFIDAWRGVEDNNRSYGWRSRLALSTVSIRDGNVREVGDYGLIDSDAWVRAYSPITYSVDGETLYVSTVQGIGSSRCNAVQAISLDDGSATQMICLGAVEAEAKGIGRIDHFVVSPDESRVAIVAGNQLWVAPFAQNAEREIPEGTSQISRDGSTYVRWISDAELAGNFAARLESWRVDDGSSEVLANVDLTVPRAQPAGGFAIMNAQIITMRGAEIIQDGAILIEGSRITWVGPTAGISVPPGATVIDGRGLTVTPGFIDVHAHHAWSSVEVMRQNEGILIDYLRYGVTTVFDPGTPSMNDIFARAEMIDVGAVRGPRTFSTGLRIIDQPLHRDYQRVSSTEDANRIADLWSRAGAIMLKSYTIPTRRQRQWLADAASTHGLGMTMEGSILPGIGDPTGLIDGHAIEHMNMEFTPYGEDYLKLFGAVDGHMTPTLIDEGPGRSGRMFFGERAHLWPADFFPPPNPSAADGDYVQFLRKLDIVALVEAGGHISVGRHGGPAVAMHAEMQLLEMAGLTPQQVLRAATYEGALKLGLEKEIGTISEGMLADLVVLDANPLEDVRNAARVKYTILNGELLDGIHLQSQAADQPAGETLH